MPHNKVHKIQISRHCQKPAEQGGDFVAVEHPLEIRLGHGEDSLHTLSVTFCTPHDIDQYVAGHLFTESIISSHKQIKSVQQFDDEFSLVVEVILDEMVDFKKHLYARQTAAHPSCGLCGKTGFDDLFKTTYPKIKPMSHQPSNSLITSLPQKLNQHQSAFQQTGGLHASALFDAQGEMIVVYEDVGRHNALDKLIGHCISHELLPLTDHIILLSGRVSFELVHKALFAGPSILAAIGAPSSLSIELAGLNQMSLIGFLHSDGFNVYT